MAESPHCPCLSGLTYAECCGRLHLGAADAPTAELLMRSRYSAFAKLLPGYLLATWHPSTRPRELVLDAGIRWFRLDILARTGGGLLDTAGTVEFTAHYRAEGAAGSQHEVSRFVRESRRWYYLGAL